MTMATPTQDAPNTHALSAWLDAVQRNLRENPQKRRPRRGWRISRKARAEARMLFDEYYRRIGLEPSRRAA